MPLRFKILLIILTFMFIIFILNNIKKKKINLKYALLWLLASILMLFCTCNIGILEFLAKIIGIKTVSNMLFLFGFLVLFVITFAITAICSTQKRKLTALVQEVGLLKKAIEEDKKW